MTTYYDPEDYTCNKTDRHERLIDQADHFRDEAKDRLLDQDGPSPEEIAADAMCDALDSIDFTASSDAAEKPPVAMLPAEPSHILTGELDGEAAGGYILTDTEDDIHMPTEATGIHYAQVARALLTRCFHLMTGREINACQIATGDFDTTEGFDSYLIELLSIQFSREIAEHINKNNQ